MDKAGIIRGYANAIQVIRRRQFMPTGNKHILVFDSGLGGTTVLKAIQEQLPDNIYSYMLDNDAFPYSNKSDAFLLERIQRLFNKLIPLAQPDLVVIACNTASTLTLQMLREHFNLPFVGVVPAIKPAAALSKTQTLALLATEATIHRDYIDQLWAAHACHCELLRLGSQRLVELAEEKIQGNNIDINCVKQELLPLMQHPLHQQIDVFILGCTHFPALKSELALAWPWPAQWIDSGDAIARRVKELCEDTPSSPGQNPEAEAATSRGKLFLTAPDTHGQKLQALQRFGIHLCQLLEID